jgi:hypothetical protein
MTCYNHARAYSDTGGVPSYSVPSRSFLFYWWRALVWIALWCLGVLLMSAVGLGVAVIVYLGVLLLS